MRNIYDFSEEDLKEEYNQNLQKNATKESGDTTQQAKDLYDKYKDYSQSQLLNEFLTTSKEKLKNGSLTQEKIEQTANLLSPYLNTQQKEFLKGLMDKLND